MIDKIAIAHNIDTTNLRSQAGREEPVFTKEKITSIRSKDTTQVSKLRQMGESKMPNH